MRMFRVAAVVSEIQIGTDDAGDMAKISAAANDRDAFDASLATEMDERGMFTPEKEDDAFPPLWILILAGVGGGLALIAAGAGAAVVRGKATRAKVADASSGARGAKGAKAKCNKVAPKTKTSAREK